MVSPMPAANRTPVTPRGVNPVTPVRNGVM